jgi:hypothetical protein
MCTDNEGVMRNAWGGVLPCELKNEEKEAEKEGKDKERKIKNKGEKRTGR